MVGHGAANEAGGYFTWTAGEKHLRRTLLWLGGVAAIVAGATLAVMGNSGSDDQVQSSTHLSIPMGITLATFGVILLAAFAVNRISQRGNNGSAPVPAGTGEQPAAGTARVTVKHSLAKELALLATLHSNGDLSASEFEAAKRHLLEG